jgi:DNA-binding LytR/AlgR family response regulator
MQRYKCIIVEDEPLAAEVLKSYIDQVHFLELKGIFEDAIYAMDFLEKEQIDLIFLDIHLPKLKGLDFLKTLKYQPAAIITSAYHQYALDSYNYNVIDYLLKPVEFARFLVAVNKLKQNNVAATERPHLFFNVSKKKIKVFLDEILYIESIKEYIRIVTETKSILTKIPLNEIEASLDQGNFIRVHRSYIVSKSKIDAFSAIEIEIKGKQIPIGRNYKEQVHALLNKNVR